MVPAIRASLHAKLLLLLAHPLIAKIVPDHTQPTDPTGDASPTALLLGAIAERARGGTSGQEEHSDQEDRRVAIALDYAEAWFKCEKEIIREFDGAVDGQVALLSEHEKDLLEHSPHDFLALRPGPITATLIHFEREQVGASDRVVALQLDSWPESSEHIKYVAIVPNLVQIQRQLDALRIIESSSDATPLAPLRVLLGLASASCLSRVASSVAAVEASASLDEYQNLCVRNAIATPHFAVIHGPPGSGKTTVIKSIVQHAVDRGDRVLVVSPTHVAVDNIVEKLAPADEPAKRLGVVPVRYAARPKKLSQCAQKYWVGGSKQQRAATISEHVRYRLCESLPEAKKLFDRVQELAPSGPLSQAVERIESVICGTPIGVLSFDPVKNAEPGEFGLLIIDEVSKLTLPEFLAIAVKARRWVLVGDPVQLPPHNDAEKNASTLDDLIDPMLELACSVGRIMGGAGRSSYEDERLVVVAREPARIAAIVRAQLVAVTPRVSPEVAAFDASRGAATNAPIVVCDPSEVPAALIDGGRLLEARGLGLPKSNLGRVEKRHRAQPSIFEDMFDAYHTHAWRSRGELPQTRTTTPFPTRAALAALHEGAGHDVDALHRSLVNGIVERFAVTAISVFDWLVGLPRVVDGSPLSELERFQRADLCEAVRPFVGTLKKQYRMHGSLSRVPREMFYRGEALLDGKVDPDEGCRVCLVPVPQNGPGAESNQPEVDAICRGLEALRAAGRASVMIITPYCAQEKLLRAAMDDLHRGNGVGDLEIEVCTLDRCQGREADFVFISLVRNRASRFLSLPKRWNVALTRARNGLVIFGDIAAYQQESSRSRECGAGRPVSLLARIIDEYAKQIRQGAQRKGDRR